MSEIVLRGVLEKAFGNILCLRGFAKFGDLADISVADEGYQREKLLKHKDEIVQFLDSGEYTFFPELILGVSLSGLGIKNDDIGKLYQVVEKGIATKFSYGDGLSVSTFVKTYKNEAFARYVTGSFYGLEHFLKLKDKPLKRIDGNHRLLAVEATEKVRQYKVPYCLVLFRNDDECQKFGRVFFHLINFRAEPIEEEKNLELILDHDDFDEESLLKAPFGEEYVMAKRFRMNEQEMQISRTGLVHFFQYLFEQGNESRGKYKDLLEKFRDCSSKIAEDFELNLDLCALVHANEGVFFSLSYYWMSSSNDYQSFSAWILKNKDMCRVGISFQEIIKIFESGRKARENTIFVSMQFGSCATEKNYQIIGQVCEDLNKKHGFNPPLIVKRVDKIITGKTYEINEQVVNEISGAGHLIADLTYCNSNVYHEIGLLMGRTLALTGKHEYGMTLILDENVSAENKIVKFNIGSLQQLRFKSDDELRKGLTVRLEKYYGVG